MPMSEFQRSRLRDGREYRNLAAPMAAQEGGGRIAEGYATVFNQPYELYSEGDYRVMEEVDRRAFDECDMTDVIFQYDHQGRVFARTRNNTLTVRPDERGLYIAADLGGTEGGRELYEEIRLGYIDRMSFGFIVSEDEIVVTEDPITGAVTVLRRILKIRKLYDVSAVSIPANDMTSISARSQGSGILSGLAQQRSREARNRLHLRLLLEGI